jgi:nucleotide-binding universal stress UspA family protein
MLQILVPLDGSTRAERAIPWADELAGALKAQVNLLHVVNPNDPTLEETLHSATPELVEKESEAGYLALEAAAGQLTRVPPARRIVLVGEPAATINAHAHEIGADLIVMSSHGRGDVQRAFLGSVADEVIRESRVPVLVIRDGVPSPPSQVLKKVLVPLDGSELSEAILSYVTPLAQTLGWNLTLFWQVDLPPPALPVHGALVPLSYAAGEGRSDMVEYLERVKADIEAKGIPAEVQVWFGNRAESIVQYAEGEHFDLIAMSTHGRSGFGRWLRGSITDYVLTHAAVPVLSVRPPKAPMSTSVAGRLASAEPDAGKPSFSITLTYRQARAVRLAVEHLLWSTEPKKGIGKDAADALQELDAAAKEAGVSLVYGGADKD